MATATLSEQRVYESAAPRYKLLLVEDDPGLQKYIASMLVDGNYAVTQCTTAAEALSKMSQSKPDLVLLDVFMPDVNGLEILRQFRAMAPTVKVLALSCLHDPRHSIEIIRLGAKDVLLKPFHKEELIASIDRCLGTTAVNTGQHIELDGNSMFVFASSRMREIRSQCALVAKVDIPVLILGESGTGKEVLAKFIHKSSPRANRVFLKVNCAAMPGDLLESELFGYEQGAFTGAVRSKPGKFELCNGGTILLDEIGEMPASLQAKLLHILQDGSFSRLGGRTTIKVDVRVLAATNIDIKNHIAQKLFREDLFYRLNGFTIQLPPLRERKEEIPVVLNYFLRRLAGEFGCQVPTLSESIAEACMSYNWPGNLRELENFVKRYLVLNDENLAIADLLGPSYTPKRSTSMAVPIDSVPSPNLGGLKNLVRGLKDEAEMEAISNALGKTRWNRKQAAVDLRISYKALLYKIKQYGIQPPQGA
jgi:two-component system, NtrC family, response regulator AtoC